MNDTPKISVEISIGDLVDRITIWQLKSEHILDPAKRANITTELEMLQSALDGAVPVPSVEPWRAELQAVNAELWSVEDQLRILERESDFGTRFIELARRVYHLNDRRAELKRKLNLENHSPLLDEKMYPEY